MATVVEHLDVLEERVREFDLYLPLFLVQRRDLHGRPERTDYCIIETITDSPERNRRALCADLLGEYPTCELGSLVCVNDAAGCCRSCAERHM